MKRRNIFRRNAFDIVRDGITPIIFTLAVIVMIVIGLRQTETASRADGLRLLNESVTRAAVQCYAVEGSYPESIGYIEENYGVYIDRTRYAVHYEIFASNILPDITVLELGEGSGR